MKISKSSLRHEMYTQKRSPMYAWVILVIAILLGLVGATWISVYHFHAYKGPFSLVASILPVPVARVGKNVVLYRKASDFARVFALNENDEDAQGEPLLEATMRLVYHAELQQLAKDTGVTVTNQEIQAALAEVEGLEAFLEDVDWSAQQYGEFVIKPLLLAQAAEHSVYSLDEYQNQSFARAEKLRADIDAGIAFTDLAEQYSSDASAGGGGFLGYFTQEELPAGTEEVFDFAVGEVSDVLSLEETFAIVRVHDAVVVGGERIQVGLQIITVQKDGLVDILDVYAESLEHRLYLR